jgi:hypothetical protein
MQQKQAQPMHCSSCSLLQGIGLAHSNSRCSTSGSLLHPLVRHTCTAAILHCCCRCCIRRERNCGIRFTIALWLGVKIMTCVLQVPINLLLKGGDLAQRVLQALWSGRHDYYLEVVMCVTNRCYVTVTYVTVMLRPSASLRYIASAATCAYTAVKYNLCCLASRVR